MNFKNILLIAFCLLSSTIFSQSEQKELKLFNTENAMPIVNATFEYGNQEGLSDGNGVIRFLYSEGTIIHLSHVNYGSWSLNDETLQIALQKQEYFRKPITVNLYPVTVIAVKPQGAQPEGELKIEVQERLEHDAADILNQTPAFNSIRKGGNYGFDPVFRGFKYDQLNVVLDGTQSATAACPNRMDPSTSQMAPNMLDRIEIFKGPHALRFGTGFGATINFIPSKLRFSTEPNFYGRLSTGYESNGNLIRGESQFGFSGEKYDASLFASSSVGDDYTSGAGETIQAEFKRSSFGANLGIKLSANQQLRVSTVYNRARDADFAALPMDLREDDTWMFNVRHDVQINGAKLQNWNSTVFGSFVDHLMDNLLKPLDPRMLNAETFAKTYNYGGRTEGEWRFGNNKMYAGADLRIEGAEGTRVRDFLMGPMAGRTLEDNAWQDGRVIRTGLFAEYQIKGQLFNYVVSGRMDFNSADVNDPTPEFTQVYPETKVSQVNPSFSFGVLKDINNKVQIGLWLARAQRSSGLTERFINYFPVGQDPFEMLGNPELNPEVNYQADLTLKWKINNGSAINVDFYAAYLQDYISSVIDPSLTPRLPTSPGVRRFVNIDKAFKRGFEISWNQQLSAGLAQLVGIAYTYGQDSERNEPLPEISPLDFRYSLFGSYLKDRLKPEVSFRYVANQSRVSGEYGETTTPSFALLDIKVGYQITHQISLNMSVNNLLDKNYYEHLNRSVRGANNAIFAPGRNVSANLNVEF